MGGGGSASGSIGGPLTVCVGGDASAVGVGAGITVEGENEHSSEWL